MKRVLYLSIFLAAVVAAFSFYQVNLEAGADASDGQRLPSDRFRVIVTDVIAHRQAVVKRIAIETHPGAWVSVKSDTPGGGGVSTASGSRSSGEASSVVHLNVLGDHLRWEKGSTNALKFLLNLEGATMSVTGPMPADAELDDVLDVSIESGVYPYDSPVAVLRFKDRVYRLQVSDRRASE